MDKNYKEIENAVWNDVLTEAKNIAEREPALRILVNSAILEKSNIFEAVASRISRRLVSLAMDYDHLYSIFCEAFEKSPEIKESLLDDLAAVRARDPACKSYIMPLLYYKGFMAITTYRVSHYLWQCGRIDLAYYLQSLNSEVFAVDIHPAARFGRGIMLDHATSFVAGETSVVEDEVSILHEVTLGGTGNEVGDRHPKIGRGVLIGAGAKIIGNIKVGKCAKIGAGSVVLDDVAPHTTVAGIPAKPVGVAAEAEPAKTMNQKIS